MGDILEEIVAFKRKEVEKFKKELSQVYLESRVEILKNSEMVSMKLALKNSTSGIIAEFKRKSPSKGWIARNASPERTAYSYQTNGATALSILTDSEFFGGSNVHIRLARQMKVYIPILYKNFIIDEYQLYVEPLLYCSLPPVSVRSSAKTSSTRLMNWNLRCCWRCIQRKKQSMQNWSRICVASTTATLAPLTLT